MNSMVFYRKYRPQKIDELDNALVREKLTSILIKSPSFHAFLFTGSRGLGKTSAARIVAKVLNCEKHNLPAGRQAKKPKLAKDLEPCNRCYQCISITNGTNIDVLEIDAASNRGIDEIRDLREKIKLSTFKARKKVYIIDEVHMLTTEAFNALLKTLEEPPSHAVFFLCTTEPQKVPATITSRCLHIPFTIATTDELLRSLKRIVSGEKISIDKEALEAIASLSDGSYRDAAKILEEIHSRARGKITKETVEKQYQITSIDHQINQMLDALWEKDVKKGLELSQTLTEQGTDMKYFLEQTISTLHSMMLAKVGIVDGPMAQEFTLEEIKKLISLFNKANLQIKYSVLPQLPLELAIIEYSL